MLQLCLQPRNRFGLLSERSFAFAELRFVRIRLCLRLPHPGCKLGARAFLQLSSCLVLVRPRTLLAQLTLRLGQLHLRALLLRAYCCPQRVGFGRALGVCLGNGVVLRFQARSVASQRFALGLQLRLAARVLLLEKEEPLQRLQSAAAESRGWILLYLTRASRFGRGRYLKILQPIVQDKKAVVHPRYSTPRPKYSTPRPK